MSNVQRSIFYTLFSNLFIVSSIGLKHGFYGCYAQCLSAPFIWFKLNEMNLEIIIAYENSKTFMLEQIKAK